MSRKGQKRSLGLGYHRCPLLMWCTPWKVGTWRAGGHLWAEWATDVLESHQRWLCRAGFDCCDRIEYWRACLPSQCSRPLTAWSRLASGIVCRSTPHSRSDKSNCDCSCTHWSRHRSIAWDRRGKICGCSDTVASETAQDVFWDWLEISRRQALVFLGPGPDNLLNHTKNPLW